MKKGDFIIYDPVGMLKKIVEETKSKQAARARKRKRKAAK